MPNTRNTNALPRWVPASGIALLSIALPLLAWQPAWEPVASSAGAGLLNRVMDGGVIVLLLSALYFLFRQRHELSRRSLGTLGFALLLTLASELLFIRHLNVGSLGSALGRAYQALAFLMFYRVIFLEGALTPFKRKQDGHSAIIESERRHRELLETAPDAILVVDAEGRIQMVNERLETMFGYTRRELLGQNLELLVPEAGRARHHLQQRAYLAAPTKRGMASGKPMQGRRKDGGTVPLDIALSAFHSEAGTQVTAFIRDVTEQNRIETELRRQSTHDELTGLPNRILFHDRLAQAMQFARRHHKQVAVALIDLDNFKAINDGWGHNYGDQLLTAVAERIRATLRAEDTVARLGGDEFGLVLSDLEQAEHIEQIINKLLRAFAVPFQIGEYEVYSGLSIGVTLFPQDGGDVISLLRNADVAMYGAKADGRGCVRFFTGEMNRATQDTLLLQTCLKRAVAEGQLVLHYQPQIDLDSGEICGVEALLRWTHPELGQVSPARFVPVAEACGLIMPIGAWVIDAACRQIRAWQDAGTPVRVAVNLSAHQFRQHDLTRSVRDALEQSGASPAMLELELTESVVMQEPEPAARVLKELAQLGVTIAIDDFGTGYSSLAYLIKGSRLNY